MIRTKVIGGLGNQLFQYATARALAQDLGVQTVLDITDFAEYTLRKPLIAEFPFSDRVTLHTDKAVTKRWDARAKLTGKWYKEKSMRFAPKVLRFGDNKTLRGYFQSEKYFARHRDIILRELAIDRPKARAIRASWGAGPVAAVHFRRGDYVGLSSYGACSDRYYHHGMDILTALVPNVRFMAFTDDPEWFQTQSGFADRCDLASQTQLEDLDEFALMSLCNHFLIANSSFSWWAAWLNAADTKQVIAPKKWFDHEKYDTSDVVPDSWMEIPK